MLSDELREGLEAELGNLELKRQRIETRIAHIKAVLAPLDPNEESPQRAATTAKTTTTATANGPLAQKGMREAIKTVLCAYPTGIKPAELALKMEQMGYVNNGKLTLKTRVWSEIGRLKKEKKVSKRGKRVVWVEKAPEASQAKLPVENEANGQGRLGMN